MNVHTALALCIVLLATMVCGPLLAQSDLGSSTESGRNPAMNVVYLEGAGILLTGALSLNYERMISTEFSLRLGYGVGWMIEHDPLECVQFTANYFLGGDHKFEICAGFCVTSADATGAGFNSRVIPACALGYRYQPVDGGLLFRAGGAWTYAYGFPIEVSLGYAF